MHVKVKLKNKLKKRRITESSVNQTYGDFRPSNLDAVASSVRRIFLSKGLFRG